MEPIQDDPSQGLLFESNDPIFTLSPGVARIWCKRWHYTGTAAGTWFMGYRPSDELLAIVGVGEGGNRFGVAEKFGLEAFPGDLEITRVVVHPAAPRNTASQAITAACDVLARRGVTWCFSYSDTAEGHHGGIYQAVNAVYVGTTARQWVNFVLNGRRVSKRVVSGRYGTTRWPDVQRIAESRGDDLSKDDWYPKLTYILPIAADRRTRRAIRTTLAPRQLPYPKRGPDLIHSATPYRNHRPTDLILEG